MLGLEWQSRPATPVGARTVTIVGAGPGDPELMTVAALKALMVADVVVADHLAPLAVLEELPPSTEVIDVAKFPRGPSTPQERINELLVEAASVGKNVVRFKGGDVHVFGRGHEEIESCQKAGIAVRVIPGVSSVTAVPTLAGIPLTLRGLVHDFTIISGHVPPEHEASLIDYDALGAMRGTIVAIMAVANAGAIAARLMLTGRSPQTPVAVIENGSMTEQRVTFSTLAEIADDMASANVKPPAVIVIGDVVAQAQEL